MQEPYRKEMLAYNIHVYIMSISFYIVYSSGVHLQVPVAAILQMILDERE